jgi:hypothetical protein
MALKINVSCIAAFIGEHPYKSQLDAFRETAEDQGLQLKDNILEEYGKSIVPIDMLDNITSQSGVSLEQGADTYVAQVKSKVISDIMQNKDRLEVPPQIREQIQQYNDISACLRDRNINGFISRDRTVKTACEALNTYRGIKLEEESTDRFQKEIGKQVIFRNNRCYLLKCRGYVLAGRCDGLIADAVVETKTRRRYWATPPTYDMIQLRAYMKLCNKPFGYLNEQFPDGTSRSTRIVHDEAEWYQIENAIEIALVSFYSYLSSMS